MCSRIANSYEYTQKMTAINGNGKSASVDIVVVTIPEKC
jgi:hypothetical protein